MIIPVRCFTCGKVLADKWEYYKKRCNELREDKDKVKDKERKKAQEPEQIKHFSEASTKQVLDELGLVRYCCRRHFIAHVDIIDTL
jgi:DNA-directed RNA polymerase subunit N (RpoN/RPB10)